MTTLVYFFITILFVVFAPYYLRRAKNIAPTKNKFEDFVENDNGYPWSWDKDRKISYEKALKLKQSENERR